LGAGRDEAHPVPPDRAAGSVALRVSTVRVPVGVVAAASAVGVEAATAETGRVSTTVERASTVTTAPAAKLSPPPWSPSAVSSTRVHQVP
jgi:hypothetical protein